MSDIVIVDPFTINDRREIAAAGFLPNGEERAVVLVPDGECDRECEVGIEARRDRIPVTLQ